MKLASFVAGGRARYGALLGDRLIDFSVEFGADLRAFLTSGRRDPVDGEAFDLATVSWLPPIPNPSKVVAIGQNYRDHCAEQNVPIPEFATVFAKFPSCLLGHLEAIHYPKETEALDYEAELAFVMGKEARNVARSRAYEYVAGYTIMNDVTARDVQRDEKQWVRGKSFDTFGPCGPYLVTTDDIPDPHQLPIWLNVNGQERQRSRTDQLVFDVPYLVEHLSHSFTLYPGDIITTGTPGGVGMFRDPPALLNRGDIIEVGIDGIGVLRNHVV